MKLLTGLFKTLGELDGDKKDLEKLPLLKEMDFVESTCKSTILLKFLIDQIENLLKII